MEKNSALGKRIQKEDSSGTVKYKLDGNNILLEEDGNGTTVVTYTYNPYGLVGNIISNTQNTTYTYYHYDATGNVMDLTDSSENVATTYTYDAFGNILSGSSALNNINFQTKPFEGSSIGLYYSRARYYDPSVGRFVSRDPIAHMNLYMFAGNNPLIYVDPLGLFGVSGGVIYYSRKTIWSYEIFEREIYDCKEAAQICKTTCPERAKPAWVLRGGRVEFENLARTIILQKRETWVATIEEFLCELLSIFCPDPSEYSVTITTISDVETPYEARWDPYYDCTCDFVGKKTRVEEQRVGGRSKETDWE